MIDPNLEKAAVDLWTSLSKHEAVVTVGAGDNVLIVYLKRGTRAPDIDLIFKGYRVETVTIEVPILIEEPDPGVSP